MFERVSPDIMTDILKSKERLPKVYFKNIICLLDEFIQSISSPSSS